MFCSNCGSTIDEGVVFCAQCGTKIDDETAVRQTTQAADEAVVSPAVEETPAVEAAVSPAVEETLPAEVAVSPVVEAIPPAAAAVLQSTSGGGVKFCAHCGKEIKKEAVVCVHCGCAASGLPGVRGTSPGASPGSPERKSKVVAGLLAIFLGGLGVHNFYLGWTVKGVSQLVVYLVGCITAIFGVGFGLMLMASIWALIEGIMCFTGHYKDARGMDLAA